MAISRRFYTWLITLFLCSFPGEFRQSATLAAEEGEDTRITRFQEYLRFNTAHPNPNYSAPIYFLIDQARRVGLDFRTFEFAHGKPVLLLTWPGSKPELSSILFNSHLDSVPVEPGHWIHPPFSAHRSLPGGEIYARGSQDDKCIAVQYIEAIAALKAKGFKPVRNVHLSYVPDEEIGGFDGMAKFVRSEEFKELDVGFALDEGQANPGDEFRVFYADRIIWHLVIKANGVPGHGAWMYDNGAMENLMKSIEVITEFRESRFDVVKAGEASNSEVISINPVYLKAGIPSSSGYVMNVQPSEAEAGFDLRLPPTADAESVRRRIDEEWSPGIRNMTYKLMPKGPLRDYKGRPIMTATNDSNPWWSVFRQAIHMAGGSLAKPEILPSTTDARYLREMGIPVLGFSPMTNTPILLHDHNEFLKDSVYLKGIKVYESIISALSSFELNSVR